MNQTADLYPPKGRPRPSPLMRPVFEDHPADLLRRLGFPVVAAVLVSVVSGLVGFVAGSLSHAPVVVEVQPQFDGFAVLPPLHTGLTEAQAWNLYRSGSLKEWQELRPEQQIAVCRYAAREYNPRFDEKQISRRAGGYAVALNTVKNWDLDIAESIKAVEETFGERLDRLGAGESTIATDKKTTEPPEKKTPAKQPALSADAKWLLKAAKESKKNPARLNVSRTMIYAGSWNSFPPGGHKLDREKTLAATKESYSRWLPAVEELVMKGMIEKQRTVGTEVHYRVTKSGKEFVDKK